MFVSDAEALGGGGAVFGVNSVTIARRAVSENATPAGAPEFTSPTDIDKQASGGQYVVSDADYGINTGGAVFRVHPTTGVRTVLSASDPAALSFVQVGTGPDFSHPSDIVVRKLSIFGIAFNPGVINTFPVALPKAATADSSTAEVSFKLNNNADVTYTVERLAKSGSATDLGSITKRAKEGLNRRPFTAKFKGEPLTPGRYRLILQAEHRARGFVPGQRRVPGEEGLKEHRGDRHQRIMRVLQPGGFVLPETDLRLT